MNIISSILVDYIVNLRLFKNLLVKIIIIIIIIIITIIIIIIIIIICITIIIIIIIIIINPYSLLMANW